MKKIVTRTLVSCAALAVMGGVLLAPTLAAERRAAAAPVTVVSVSDQAADIGEAGARTSALEQAGLTAQQVSWITARRDYEDAVAVLERIPKEVLDVYMQRPERGRNSAYDR